MPLDGALSCACVAQHEHVALPMALFFVMLGAAVALQVFAPLTSAKQPTMRIGGLLLVVAGLGKCLAGYAPFWWRGKQSVRGSNAR